MPMISIPRHRRFQNATLSTALLALVLAVSACGGGGSPSVALDGTAQPAASPTPGVVAGPMPTPTPTPTRVASEPAAPGGTSAQPSVEVDVPPIASLSKEAFDLLVELTEKHSPRASATAEERAAAEYIAGLFTGLGYATEIRPFTVDLVRSDPPVLQVHSSSTQAGDFPPGRAFPLTLSGEGEATGVLVSVGAALASEVESDSLIGRVVLIERGTITFQQKVARVEAAGAVAAIIYNFGPGAFAGRLTTRSAIPTVSVSREQGEALLALLESGEVAVTVSVVIEARDSANVVAELPGTDPNSGVVILGGHYDTVPGVDGANDNGSGIAALLTVARHAAELGYPFGLRFIAFGTEEEGLFGSREYVDSLGDDETREIVAMLNFDALGSGDTSAMIATPWLGELVLELGDQIGLPVRLDPDLGLNGGSSDFAPFEAAGVPFVFFFADDFSRIHTAEDTLDHIDPARIGEAAALGLATLEALAAGG